MGDCMRSSIVIEVSGGSRGGVLGWVPRRVSVGSEEVLFHRISMAILESFELEPRFSEAVRCALEEDSATFGSARLITVHVGREHLEGDKGNSRPGCTFDLRLGANCIQLYTELYTEAVRALR